MNFLLSASLLALATAKTKAEFQTFRCTSSDGSCNECVEDQKVVISANCQVVEAVVRTHINDNQAVWEGCHELDAIDMAPAQASQLSQASQSSGLEQYYEPINPVSASKSQTTPEPKPSFSPEVSDVETKVVDTLKSLSTRRLGERRRAYQHLDISFDCTDGDNTVPAKILVSYVFGALSLCCIFMIVGGFLVALPMIRNKPPPAGPTKRDDSSGVCGWKIWELCCPHMESGCPFRYRQQGKNSGHSRSHTPAGGPYVGRAISHENATPMTDFAPVSQDYERLAPSSSRKGGGNYRRGTAPHMPHAAMMADTMQLL